MPMVMEPVVERHALVSHLLPDAAGGHCQGGLLHVLSTADDAVHGMSDEQDPAVSSPRMLLSIQYCCWVRVGLARARPRLLAVSPAHRIVRGKNAPAAIV